MIKIARTVEEARNAVAAWKKEGLRVGLVPTMGYLHEGHESLMQQAVKDNDKVVVSIFVNPTQFGPNEDLDSYPRDMEHDLERCKARGVALVFTPEAEMMYPSGSATTISVGGLTDGLCGRSRPTHFQGVATVVCKLFNIIKPDSSYFGQKDAQQLAVIKRMASDLNMTVEVIGCPIVREPDGLAKSSRNVYLTPEGRVAALVLNRSVRLAESMAQTGERSAQVIAMAMQALFDAEPLVKVDYIEIVDALTMQPVQTLKKETLVAVAAHVGKSRLLDNTVVQLSDEIV